MSQLRSVLSLSLLALGLMAGGCGRAAGEVIGIYTGPKHVVSVLERVPGSLGDYSRFEVVPFADQTGGRVPSEVPLFLPRDLDRSLAEDGIPYSGGKTLLVRGAYLYYENSDRVLDQVFGPFEEVVARVELVDKASGSVLGVANCVGRSDTSYNKGPAKKAEGLAKAIASWIGHSYPKSMKTK